MLLAISVLHVCVINMEKQNRQVLSTFYLRPPKYSDWHGVIGDDRNDQNFSKTLLSGLLTTPDYMSVKCNEVLHHCGMTVVWQIWHSGACVHPLPPKKIQHPDTVIEQSVKYSNRTVTLHNTIKNTP